MKTQHTNREAEDHAKHQKYEKWVALYAKELYSWAYYKTSDQAKAEDLVQDTFLSAYKADDSFKGRSHPKTWLFTILKNKLIDHYRTRITSFLSFESESEKFGFELTEGLFDKDGHWTGHNILSYKEEDQYLLDNPDFRKVLKICLDDLPDHWKTALLSKYLLNKKGKDICKELNISPANYWQILHRAKLMVRKCLELYWFKKKN